jgi:hypothetical protein
MTKYVGTDIYNETWFNGTPEQDATLWVDYLAGLDGYYKWNNADIVPSSVNQWKYAGLNTYSVPMGQMGGNKCLKYSRGPNSWYKINFAVLATEP